MLSDLRGFYWCQRSTCGIRLIYRRPAWTDGLHYIVSIHNPQGHPWHHQFLIQLRSWIFIISLVSQTMWWKRRPKFHWAYVVGYGSNYHPHPHLSLDIFGHMTMSVWLWCIGCVQGDHPKWNYDADLNGKYDFYWHSIPFSDVFCCLSSQLVGPNLPANMEHISQGNRTRGWWTPLLTCHSSSLDPSLQTEGNMVLPLLW